MQGLSTPLAFLSHQLHARGVRKAPAMLYPHCEDTSISANPTANPFPLLGWFLLDSTKFWGGGCPALERVLFSVCICTRGDRVQASRLNQTPASPSLRWLGADFPPDAHTGASSHAHSSQARLFPRHHQRHQVAGPLSPDLSPSLPATAWCVLQMSPHCLCWPSPLQGAFRSRHWLLSPFH